MPFVRSCHFRPAGLFVQSSLRVASLILFLSTFASWPILHSSRGLSCPPCRLRLGGRLSSSQLQTATTGFCAGVENDHSLDRVNPLAAQESHDKIKITRVVQSFEIVHSLSLHPTRFLSYLGKCEQWISRFLFPVLPFFVVRLILSRGWTLSRGSHRADSNTQVEARGESPFVVVPACAAAPR